jgi:hypothetical protein
MRRCNAEGSATMSNLTDLTAKKAISHADLYRVLLTVPDEIETAQRAYNKLNRQYERRIADVRLRAHTAQLFTDAKTGNPRAASNEREYETAFNALIYSIEHGDTALADLIDQRDDALATLTHLKNQLESVQYAARVFVATKGKAK